MSMRREGTSAMRCGRLRWKGTTTSFSGCSRRGPYIYNSNRLSHHHNFACSIYCFLMFLSVSRRFVKGGNALFLRKALEGLTAKRARYYHPKFCMRYSGSELLMDTDVAVHGTVRLVATSTVVCSFCGKPEGLVQLSAQY
jgi:hypothetical protein